MDDDKSKPAAAGPVQGAVRPTDGVVLDAEGWPVLTQRGSEGAHIKYRGGQRVYSQAALDAAVAAERERCAATEIDYKAAIAHCHATLGHEQGTRGCIAFARGAEWALAQLRA
jgi:hypothetical protein